MGTNENNEVAAYAKENNIEYSTYKFTKAKPNGLSIMLSPQFMLFPKSKRKSCP